MLALTYRNNCKSTAKFVQWEKWNKTDQNEKYHAQLYDETILQNESDSELEFVAKLQPKDARSFASWGVFQKVQTCEVQKLKVVKFKCKHWKILNVQVFFAKHLDCIQFNFPKSELKLRMTVIWSQKFWRCQAVWRMHCVMWLDGFFWVAVVMFSCVDASNFAWMRSELVEWCLRVHGGERISRTSNTIPSKRPYISAKRTLSSVHSDKCSGWGKENWQVGGVGPGSSQYNEGHYRIYNIMPF